MEPKTIEEYREFVKDLKLQLRKAEKKNVELIVRMTDKTKAQDKEKKGASIEEAVSLTKRAVKIQSLWRGYIQRKKFRQDLRTIAKSDPKAGVKIHTNNTALAEISTAVKRIGLNLEMLFRACDVDGKGEVSLEDFRLFIKRLGLKKISQAQINRFLHAIDEDCTGIISKEEYHNCLAAYTVASEKGRAGSRTFEQDCILKFATVLKARDVKPEEVYNFCDVKQTGVVTAAQLSKFIRNLSDPFQDKEIHGIIQYLDVDGDHKIPKDFFLQELNKAGTISERVDYQSPTRSPTRPSQTRSPDSYNARPIKLASFGEDSGPQRKPEGPKKIDTPKFEEKAPGRVIKPITVKKPVAREPTKPSAAGKNEGDQELKNLKRMIVKMELAGKPIYQFLENFLLSLQDPAKGVSGNELLKILEKDYPEDLTRQEKIAFVKALDHSVTGAIDIKETKQFFLTISRESKEKIISGKLLQICIAKTLDAENQTTEAYVKALGLPTAQRMKLKDFQNKLGDEFDLNQDRAEEIFKEFEDRGTGTVDLAAFFNTVNSYRGKTQGAKQPQGASKTAKVDKVEKVDKVDNFDRFEEQESPVTQSGNRSRKGTESGEAETKGLKRILVKMELNSKPIYTFLENFLIGVNDPAKGVSASEFSKMLEKEYGNALAQAEKTALVKALDQNVNGTVDIFEVKHFFLTMQRESKEKVISGKLLQICIAKTLDAENQTTEAYVKALGLPAAQRMKLKDFQNKLIDTFDLERDRAEEICKDFEDRGTGTVDLAAFFNTVNSYRSGQSTAAGIQAAGGKVLKLPTNVQGLMEQHVKKIVEKEPQKETKDFKKAITKLELELKPIYDLMLNLLKEMPDPKAGLPLNRVQDMWKKQIENAITDKELATVLGKIDVKQEGQIDVEDLLAFVNSNAMVTKERLISSELIIVFMAKSAQAEPASTIKYLEKFNIFAKSRLRVQDFKDRLDDLLTIPDEYEHELFAPFNHNSSGYVDLEGLIAKINSYRSDLTDSGKISYKVAVETLLKNEIYKVLVDDSKEKAEKEARVADEQALALFKNALREKGIKPMDFFGTAANGQTSCNVMSLKTAIQRAGVKLNPQDLTKVLKLLDVNGNGTLQLQDYEMAVLDEEGLKILQSKVRGDRDNGAIDEDVVNKVKDVLSEMEVANIQLFKESDTKGAKVINLLQLKDGVKRMIPCSRLSFAETVKFLRSIDIHYNGVIKEEDFNFAMNRTKPGTRVVQGQDSRAELMNPAKIQAIGGGGKDDDLKDAIQKLKSVLFNPKVNLKPEQIFKKFDLNNDKVITREEFLQAVDSFDSKVNISERQKVLLVTLADKNRDNKIDYNEFVDLLKTVGGDTQTAGVTDNSRNPAKGDVSYQKGITSRSRTNISAVADVVEKHEEESADKAFDEYMATITIKEEDYFRPDPKATHKNTTVVNNMVVALKRCHQIVKELEAKKKTLWDDPDFGPQNLEDHGQSSLYVDERPAGYPDPENIHWFRPSEIVKDQKAVFMDKDADTNDVIQGQIGDCWLIGGFSVLATQPDYIRGGFNPNPELLKQIKDKELSDEEAEKMQMGLWCPVFHYLRKYGIYVIRFFKNYCWRYVIMDDKLPCYKEDDDEAEPALVFGKCRNHYEFWVPLLEKAYAKLHGCYETIVAGYIDDGLTDMTGLVSNKYKLQGPKGFPGPQVGSAEELWQKLLFYRQNYTMMGCSIQGQAGETEKEVTIDGEPMGLLKNHAYSILDILEIPNPNARNAHKSHRLLRIRNPWGTKEWTGEWSDGSTKLLLNISKLNAYIKEKARKGRVEQFDPEADDGTFLMSFKDWREIFHNLFCCVDFPDEWSGLRFYDYWTKENSGGTPLKPDAQNVKDWAKNPQFVLNINNKKKKSTKLMISLGQNDGRLLKELKFPYKENINPAVFTVASLKSGEKKLEMFDGSRIKKLSALKEYRDNSIDIELENGNYVIVPSTGSAGQTGLFVLNVYFDCEKSDITITKAGSTLKGEFIQEEEETPLHYDKELKKILKLKLIALLCEDELEASLNKSQTRRAGKSQEKIESLLDMSQSNIKKKGRETSQMNKSKTIVKEDWDPAEANKVFNDIMKRQILEDKDFFRPDCTTIMNNEMTALKQCYEILRGMKRQGKKFFVDPDFGPKSADDPGLEYICEEPDNPPHWVGDPESVKWLRIKDIAPSGAFPHFLSNGAETGDVVQGDLGDCWFISALSVLANDDRKIKGDFKPTKEAMREISDEEAKGMTSGVYPPIFHWLRQFGIYVLRFYKNYDWRYVIIDDRIPCRSLEDEPKIIFAKCLAKDEFWVPLIEKAYAKIHNTYEALAKGAIDDGLADMTAMVSDKSKIQERAGKTPESRTEFWKDLMAKAKEGTLMGCSIKALPGETEAQLRIDGEGVGIYKGHAYSILDVFELHNPQSEKDHKTHRLLRIRNPWGHDEWSGKWGEKSDKFAENVHKIEKYMRDRKAKDPEYEIMDTKAMDDGTFLMCYKDWRTYFNNLFECLDFPNAWSGLRMEDAWTKENSGGFPTAKDAITWAKNPQFVLTITEPTECFLSLGQQDARLVKGQKYPFPGVVHCIMALVIKLNDGEEREGLKAYDHSRILKSTPAKEYKETSVWIDNLEPGKYLVVPCTKSPRLVGNFFLEIYFSCPKEKIKFTKVGSTTAKAEIIEAEEEGAHHYDDDFKLVLKAKAAEVIDGEEKSLLEKTLSFID